MRDLVSGGNLFLIDKYEVLNRFWAIVYQKYANITQSRVLEGQRALNVAQLEYIVEQESVELKHFFHNNKVANLQSRRHCVVPPKAVVEYIEYYFSTKVYKNPNKLIQRQLNDQTEQKLMDFIEIVDNPDKVHEDKAQVV